MNQPDSESDLDRVLQVVTAYVSNNKVDPAILPALIEKIFATVYRLKHADDPLAWVDEAIGGKARGDLAEPRASSVATQAQMTPAVPIDASITEHEITCLECGKSYKSLRRHLGAVHNLSPAQYRANWKLPASYPMVTKAYSEARSDVAKRTGLGLNSPRSKSS